MTILMRDRMTTTYANGTSDELCNQVRALFIDQPDTLAIVRDDQGLPATVVSLADLPGPTANEPRIGAILSQLPPGLTAEAETPLEAFVSSDAFTAFDFGARGVMVLDDGQPIGVVTALAIQTYLASEQGLSRTRGFTTLPGSIQTPRIVMYCKLCQHRNELDYLNRLKPPDCQVVTPYVHGLL